MSKPNYAVFVLPSNKVRFRIGVQAFTLGYEPTDEAGCTAKEQAEWMAAQLKKALDKLAGADK